MLARALDAREPCRIVSARERPWASVTFSGARHSLRLELAADRAGTFLEGIEEAPFDLGEHLLADLIIVGREARGDRASIAIEALTIEGR